jgi:hypothetical protein
LAGVVSLEDPERTPGFALEFVPPDRCSPPRNPRMNGNTALATRLREHFAAAERKVQTMAKRLLDGISPSESELEGGLKDLFTAVKECADGLRTGNVAATDLGDQGQLKADVLETWDSLAETHLPVSLALLRTRFEQPPDRSLAPAVRLQYGRTSDPSSGVAAGGWPVLLLMAGFSIEQLVLCIAFHYRVGAVRRVVPFAGQLAGGGTSWGNEHNSRVLSGLQTLGITAGNANAAAGADFLTIDRPIPVDASSPARVFQKILAWSRAAENADCRGALDVTGGQKPMDSGASYAAMYLGWPAYYLDFTVYDRQLRRPKPHSLRYAELLLPSSAFSLDARKFIVELFERCRFGRALHYVEALERAASKSFLDQADCEDVAKAKTLISISDAWLRADYFDELMQAGAGSLCGYFRGPLTGPTGTRRENAPAGKPEHGFREPDLREKLRRLMDAPDTEVGQAPLLTYAIDEYWRIKSTYDASLDCRECLVATHGLAEVLVDGLLHMKALALTVTDVFGVVLYPRDEMPPEVQDRSQVAPLLKGLPVPVRRLPPAAGGDKRKVLLTGTGKFELRVPCGNAFTADRPACQLIARIPECLASDQESGRDDFIELDTSLTLCGFGGRPLVTNSAGGKLSSKLRDACWGVYKWSELRNLTAHWRAPLGEDFHDLVRHALQDWLPRYVGLYARAALRGTSGQGHSDEECLSEGRKQIGEGSCRPWHNKAPELRRWLRLP